VRNLEREIARLCRRLAREKASAPGLRRRKHPREISPEDLESFLGTPRFLPSTLVRSDRTGIATALAWSETGGSILQIEVGVLPGRGRLTLTGQLGSTLRESARAALSCVRSRAGRLGLARDFYRSVDIHLHIPEGEVPKDGPSAGAAIALAMVSALVRRPTRESVALTGELTLTGRILPIGGLSEKLLAALRAGVQTVLVPSENERQLGEVPPEIRDGLRVVAVSRIDEVFSMGLAARRAASARGRQPGAIVRLPRKRPAAVRPRTGVVGPAARG
jgi:ATP-dependent Lon protease